MIREKNKVPKMPRPTTVTKILELHELFLTCFLAFVQLYKKLSKSSTLKQAVAINNKFSNQNGIKNCQVITVGFKITNS